MPSVLAVAAAVLVALSREPVACPSVTSTIAFAFPSCSALSAVCAVVMPTSWGLPPFGAGSAPIAAVRALWLDPTAALITADEPW